MGFRLIHFFTSALLLSLLAGCGGAKTGAMPPKEEAVKLMDTGENAKAAAILEDSLAKHPDDDEAKLLLASSYMGMAGIDVYKIFDAFKDLIFKKSLKDQIITPHDGVADHPSLGDGAIPDQDPAKTKSEIAVAKFDKTLSTLQLALIYLDRFPQIDEEKWPLVESALATLQSMKNPAGDTFVYRVLIRVIYSKSYPRRARPPKRSALDARMGLPFQSPGFRWRPRVLHLSGALNRSRPGPGRGTRGEDPWESAQELLHDIRRGEFIGWFSESESGNDLFRTGKLYQRRVPL